MSPGSTAPTRLRFGVFEADLRLGVLTRQGHRVRLQEQPFQVLVMLLSKPGELVTREDLHQALWPRSIVDFDHGLNKAVSKIRDALGDTAASSRFVETIPGRGYRFLADVTAIADASPEDTQEEKAPVASSPGLPEASPAPPDSASPPSAPPGSDWFKPLLWTGSVLTLLIVAFVLAGVFEPPKRPDPALRSLVVLPFRSLSDDPSQEYFAEGMTDELITDLGQVATLRVISHTSAMAYRDTHKTLADIARELDVQAVVEGNVRREGDHVRISAQLIRVPADEHLWAHSYDGNIRESLALQGEVAHAIVQQIGATLTQTERVALDSTRPVNPDAYEAYLKGRYFWNRRTREGLEKSLEEYNLAITIDPTYSPAYSGLADSYALAGDWEYGILSPQEAFEKSQAAGLKAVSLDNSSAQAHASLGLAQDLFGWDWSVAEYEFQRALELNPGYATAHQWLGWHFLVTGREQEGLFELRKAERLDPLSLIIGADLADGLSIAHRPDDAIQQSLKVLDTAPEFAMGHYQLGQAYEQKQQHERAIAEFQKAIELAGHSAVVDSCLAYAYAVSGQRARAESVLKDILVQTEHNPAARANVALVYVGLNEPDQAMAWLERAYTTRFNPSILLRPAFDPLRSDVRFQGLLDRMGLKALAAARAKPG